MWEINELNSQIDTIQGELSKKNNSPILSSYIDSIQEYINDSKKTEKEKLLRYVKQALEKFKNWEIKNITTLEVQLSNLVDEWIKIDDDYEKIKKMYDSWAYNFLSNELKELLEKWIEDNNLKNFNVKVILFMSNLLKGDLQESKQNIENILNIKNIDNLSPWDVGKKLELILNQNVFDKINIYINNIFWNYSFDDIKIDFIAKIAIYFYESWKKEKSLEFLNYAFKNTQDEKLKQIIWNYLNKISPKNSNKSNKNNSQKEKEIKEIKNKNKQINKIFDNLNKDLSEIENSTKKIETKNYLEKQKEKLVKLWIDVSNINSKEELIKKIQEKLIKNKEKIKKLKSKNKEIKQENFQIKQEQENLDKIKQEKIKEINNKILSEKQKAQKIFKEEEKQFEKENFEIFSPDFHFNQKQIIEKQIKEQKNTKNITTEKFGFLKNEINFHKKNFLITWIDWSYNIATNIKNWYETNLIWKVQEYIWELKNYINESNKKTKIFYFDKITAWIKEYKLKIPSSYNPITNQISFNNKNVKYNIVRWDLWITYLIFNEELKENITVKIWLEKDNIWFSKVLETTWSIWELENLINIKNKEKLNSIKQENISQSEKVQKVINFLKNTSYYNFWDDNKISKNIISWVEKNSFYEKIDWEEKRPLICNLANNLLVAYLKYIWIKSVYIWWLASNWYWEYSWHWWVKYFDEEKNKWIEIDATPSVNPNFPIKKTFENKEIEKIENTILEKKLQKEKIEKEISKKIKKLEEKKSILTKKNKENNNKINNINEINNQLENILTPEKNKNNLEQTLKNTREFKRIFKNFLSNFLTNIQILRQEKEKIENKYFENDSINIQPLTKEKFEENKEFYQNLYSFLKNSIEIILAKLEDENISFWEQYAYIIWLTNLIKNFKKEIYEIEPEINQKIDNLKAKIKQEKVFLNEYQSIWNQSLIRIWNEFFIQKSIFDIETTWLKNNKKWIINNWYDKVASINIIRENNKTFILYLTKEWLKKEELDRCRGGCIFNKNWELININNEEEKITSKLKEKLKKDFYIKEQEYYNDEVWAKIFENPDIKEKKKFIINSYTWSYFEVWLNSKIKLFWNNILEIDEKNNEIKIYNLEDWNYLENWTWNYYNIKNFDSYKIVNNKLIIVSISWWWEEKMQIFWLDSNWKIQQEIKNTFLEDINYDFLNKIELKNFFQNKEIFEKFSKDILENYNISIWETILWEDWKKYKMISIFEGSWIAKSIIINNEEWIIFEIKKEDALDLKLKKVDKELNLFLSKDKQLNTIFRKNWTKVKLWIYTNLKEISFENQGIEYNKKYNEEEYKKYLNNLILNNQINSYTVNKENFSTKKTKTEVKMLKQEIETSLSKSFLRTINKNLQNEKKLGEYQEDKKPLEKITIKFEWKFYELKKEDIEKIIFENYDYNLSERETDFFNKILKEWKILIESNYDYFAKKYWKRNVDSVITNFQNAMSYPLWSKKINIISNKDY